MNADEAIPRGDVTGLTGLSFVPGPRPPDRALARRVYLVVFVLNGVGQFFKPRQVRHDRGRRTREEDRIRAADSRATVRRRIVGAPIAALLLHVGIQWGAGRQRRLLMSCPIWPFSCFG